LKHFVERPIFDDGRYCDASVHSAKGWIVYNADGDSVGLHQTATRRPSPVRWALIAEPATFVARFAQQKIFQDERPFVRG
jgi:hypothetical protein